MAAATDKVIDCLRETRAAQDALVEMFTDHLAITPAGTHRKILEQHLRATRKHARLVDTHLYELGERRGLRRAGRAFAQTLAGPTVTFSRLPFDLLAGTGDLLRTPTRGAKSTERLLKNAQQEYAATALALATCQTLEQVARCAEDDETAQLAATIRHSQQGLLDDLPGVIDELAETMVCTALRGMPAYESATIGATQAVRAGARRLRTAAEHIPGVPRLEGEVKGALATEAELPLPTYGELSAAQITERLPQLSQVDLATIEGYERRHAGRTTVLNKINALRGPEPWLGYDEMSAEEIRSRLGKANGTTADEVLAYEPRHQNRKTVLEAAEAKA